MGLQRATGRPSDQDIPVDPRLARRSGAAPSTGVSPQTSTPLVAPQPRQGASAGLSADTEPRAASAGVSRAPELSWVEQKRAEQRAASARPYGRPTPEYDPQRLTFTRGSKSPCGLCDRVLSSDQFSDLQLARARRFLRAARAAGRKLTASDLPKCERCVPEQRVQFCCRRCKVVKPATDYSRRERTYAEKPICRLCYESERDKKDSIPRVVSLFRPIVLSRFLTPEPMHLQDLELDPWEQADGGVSSGSEDEAKLATGTSIGTFEPEKAYMVGQHYIGEATVVYDDSDDDDDE
ncbi:hypothetical protein JCM8202v2_000483 [Rhodotorula sphaerocarpa]